MSIIKGTTLADKLTGSLADEDIYGLGGNDEINGAGGHDRLFGGDGDDRLIGGLKWDSAKNAWVWNTSGAWLDGGAGNDTLEGGVGSDTLIGGDGNDSLFGEPSYNGVSSTGVTHGNDILTGQGGDDQLYGGAGADQMDGGDGNDLLVGMDGNDVLNGGAGNDNLRAGAGNDYLDGGTGNNLLQGDDGDDTYLIHSFYDVVYDSSGNDKGTIYVDFYKPNWRDVETWTWAQGVKKLPYWIDALTNVDVAGLSSNVSATRTVKYCFAQTPPSFFDDKDKTGFTPFNADQVAYTKKMFTYIESVLNLHFVETTDPAGAYTIVFANNTQDESGGYAQEIGPDPRGKVLVGLHDLAQNPSADGGQEFFRVALHEVGHALGLKHPFADEDALGGHIYGPYLPDAEDNADYTVMSYTASANHTWGTYSPMDLAALQCLYDPAAAYHAGDTRYGFSSTGGVLVGDGGGVDTIDCSAETAHVFLTLRPGEWSYVGKQADTISAPGQLSINFGSAIENAIGGSGSDIISGNSMANVIDGGAGTDTLYGGAGDDVLSGGAGNDFLMGEAGNDRLDGGDGLDQAWFNTKRDGFTLQRTAGGWTVTDKSGVEGTDTLVNVERLSFIGASIALDIDGVAGQAYRLYAAAFNRTPDLGGLGYWLKQMDYGMSLVDVATGFTTNAEFTQMYGATRTHDSFIGTLYNNVLHRAPDQAGVDYWAKAMDGGMTEGQVLAQFSESPENQAQVIGQISNGITYQPYIG